MRLLPIFFATAVVAGAGPEAAAALEIAGFDIERDLPNLGVWGPLAIIVLRFVAALSGVVPSSPVLLAAGATEGILLGSLYVLIGALSGAMAAFAIGRRVGRNYVVQRGWMDAIAETKFGRMLLAEDSTQTRLMAAVFYCRLIPGINLDALSYVAGVMPITAWRFGLATLGALLPYTLLLVAIGQELVDLDLNQVLVILLAILAVGATPVIWRVLFKGRPKKS